MKILLVGNIANNSYLLAKFLRRRGIEADVLIYDYKHIMGQPEWEDGEFDEKLDEFDPDLSKVKNFELPSWVIRTTLSEIGISTTSYTKKIDAFLNHFITFMNIRIMQPLNKENNKYYLKLCGVLWNLRNKYNSYLLKKDNAKHINKIIEEYNNIFPDRNDELSYDDVYKYYYYPLTLSRIWDKYDLLHLADVNPVYGLIDGSKPFVAFEHGTLRDIPFENTAQGRLLSLAYKKAEKVIITNCDCIHSANKLKLNNHTFIPHPIDDDKFRPIDTPIRKEFLNKFDVEFIILFPARQSYGIKGTDKALKAFGRFLKKHPKSLMILPKWGEDAKIASSLIDELGMKDNIHQIDPLTRLQLVDYYNMADVVFDQFILGAFGTTTPEAMSCGKPLFLYLNEDDHEWAFPEMPPVINVFSEDEIYDELLNCKEKEGYIQDIGEKSRKWIKEYHGWESVTDRLENVYNEVLKNKTNENTTSK